MTWPPPKKNSVQIKHLPSGRLSVRCRHGWELADDHEFALQLYEAAWGAWAKAFLVQPKS